VLIAALAVLAFASPLQASEVCSAAARAEQIHLQARARFEQSGTNVQAAWQLGQACFEWAEFATSNTQRAEIANEGINVCRLALSRDAALAPAHYYLAMNLAQLARTKTIGALKIVSEMEAVYKRTIALDPMIDFAGPHRSLGLLYRDAPGWPASIGSHSKARQHLLKAVELRPEFPENWLCLLETYVKWGERKNALARLKEVEAVLKTGREKFAGEPWAASWEDWDRRWREIRDRIYP